MEKVCEPMNCEKCGWNPEVNEERRKAIRWYAKNKCLPLWGAKIEDQKSEMGKRAIRELARMAREESK